MQKALLGSCSPFLWDSAGGGTRAYSYIENRRNDTVLWLDCMKSTGAWPLSAPRAAVEAPKREVDARSALHPAHRIHSAVQVHSSFDYTIGQKAQGNVSNLQEWPLDF